MKETSNSPTHTIKQALVSGNVPGANNLYEEEHLAIFTLCVFISQNTNACV